MAGNATLSGTIAGANWVLVESIPTSQPYLTNTGGSGIYSVVVPPGIYAIFSSPGPQGPFTFNSIVFVTATGDSIIPIPVGGLSVPVLGGNSVDANPGNALVLGGANASLVSIGRGASKQPLESSTLTVVPDAASTLTAAQLLGGALEQTPTAARTDTTDTAANLDAAIPGAAVGDNFQCTLANQSAGAFAITIAGGTGVTLKGSTTTIGQNKLGTLTFRKTGAGAWTCYISVSA